MIYSYSHLWNFRSGIMMLAVFIMYCLLFLGCKVKDGQKSPGKIYGHDMVYHEARKSIVLFGGFGPDSEPLDQTWIWNGRWTRSEARGPSPRKWPAMAYDSQREEVVLFGGRAGSGGSGDSLDDTWIWDGEWKYVNADGPGERDHHRMVYDKRRNKTVLFGGWNGKELLGDTWEWDGMKWKKVSDSGPNPRAPFAVAYDVKNRNVLLHGGKDLEHFFGDTWVWNGESWNEIETEGPSPRAFHAMTYDRNNDRILLFSGRYGDIMYSETWAWDGSAWTLLDDRGPVRRGVYSLVFDSEREVSVFHGSGIRQDEQWILNNETWFWNGSEWRVDLPDLNE